MFDYNLQPPIPPMKDLSGSMDMPAESGPPLWEEASRQMREQELRQSAAALAKGFTDDFTEFLGQATKLYEFIILGPVSEDTK